MKGISSFNDNFKSRPNPMIEKPTGSYVKPMEGEQG